MNIIGVMTDPYENDKRIATHLANQHFFFRLDLYEPIDKALVALFGTEMHERKDRARRQAPLPFNPAQSYESAYETMGKFAAAVGGPRAIYDAAERRLANLNDRELVILGLKSDEDAQWASSLGAAIVQPRHSDLSLTTDSYDIDTDATPGELMRAVDALWEDIQKQNRLVLKRERGEPVQAV